MHLLRRWSEAGYAALAAVLSAVFGLLVIQPWRGALDVPYAYIADANLYRAEVKGILEHGWYWRNPDLGAPAGQQLFDFPGLSGDPLHVLLIKAIGLFSSDAAVVVNVFFLLTFPLVGLAAYLVFRRLTLSVPVAIVCSLLFTLMPYHFWRGELHLLLSAYWVVPLGAYLVLAVLGERPLLSGRRVLVGTLVMCALIALASGGYYYAAFTMVLVASAALLRAGATRSLRPLWQGGAVVGAIFVVSLVTLAPSFVYWAKHGTNDDVAHRLSYESELYGLKAAQLVLPMEHHRVGFVGDVRREYNDWFVETEAAFATPLGVVATAGFLFLLGVCLLQMASPGRVVAAPLLGQAGIASLIALLFAWTGGLSTLVASVFSQIRSWNRLSIYIAFFALLAVGVLLDRGVARLRSPALAAGLVFGVLLVGVLDQTSSAFRPAYSALEAEYRSDEDFVAAIEERLPEGAMVFQLPYHPFPETPGVERMADYDLMRGYLHSRDLRWSYGFTKGRPGDPSRAISQRRGRALVRAAREAGYAGIYIDRFGYYDDARILELELADALGESPMVSRNERLSFFELPG